MTIAALLIAFGPFLQSPAEEANRKQSPIRHDVVITATRIETPVREVAAAVTLLTRTDLDRALRTSVFDALENAPGLTLLRNGGPGGVSSVFIRGMNSEHVLVTLDGLPLNDPVNPSRSFDFAHLSLAGVDRIEVLRGPQSPLYGSDAVGGAVNILTARGGGKPRLTMSAAGGSYRTFDGSLDVQGSAGVVRYAFGLSGSATRGISAAGASYPGNAESDGGRGTTLAGRLGATLKKGAEFDLIIRGVSARTDLDNFGGPFGDDLNHVQKLAAGLVRLQARFLQAGGRLEQKIGLSAFRSERTYDNPADPDHPGESEGGSFQGSRLRFDWQNNLFLHAAQTLTFGFEAEKEAGRSEYRYESAWGPGESLFPGRAAGRTGFYLQDQVRIKGRFFAAVGLRLDRHERSGLALTYRLAPAYLIERTGTKLRATLGTAFKAPSLYQLYAPATSWGPVGHPGLKAERSLGWEAGFEQSLWAGRVEFGLVYFRNDLENLIDFDFGQGYVNVGRARTRGLEASLEARPADGLEGRLSYAQLEACDAESNTPLPRRPKDRFTAGLRWAAADRFEAGFSAAYTGPRPDRDYGAWPARPVTLAGFWLLGADASFAAGGGTRLFLRLDNILGVRYETIFGYGSPGRVVYGGVRLNL